MDRMIARPLGHSTNLVGVPTALLGSPAFNRDPVALHVSGVREMNARLFEMLDVSDDLAGAAEAVDKYMVAMFGIDPEQQDRSEGGDAVPDRARRPYRSSFLRLLLGWGFDSNGPEGAVLKGWVESRFGLIPTFHKDRIDGPSGAVWAAYVEEKMSSRFHGNSIQCQLDILYEYCQWAIARHVAPGQRHMTLYRGVNSFEDHQSLDRIDRRTVILRLNSLVSFTSSRDVADCFGETILTVEVPVVKILFFNALLPLYPLKGESEILVIGGDYLAHADKF